MKVDEQLAVIRDPKFLDDVRSTAAKVIQFNKQNDVTIEGGWIAFALSGVKVRVQVNPGVYDANIEAGNQDESDPPTGDPLYSWSVPVGWLQPASVTAKAQKLGEAKK